MIFRFIIHQWKQTVRSILWQRNLAGTIIFSIVIFLFIVNLLGLGLFIDRFFKTAFPDQDPVALFNGILLYYFCFDLILRFFMQKSSGMQIEPYLILPVSRKVIIHYILIKTVFSFFNVLPFLILIPFAVKLIAPHYSGGIALVWLSGCLFIMLGNGYLSHLLRNLLMVTPGRIILPGFLLVCMILLDKSGILHLSLASGHFFNGLCSNPYLILIPLVYLAGNYGINTRLLMNHLYSDRMSKNRQAAAGSGSFSCFERFGETGSYIILELKMLMRNKRTRATLIFAGMMLLVAPLFYLSFSREMNYYPKPDAPSQYSFIPVEGKPSVTFRVIPGKIPEECHVYITGDHPKLGPWKPSAVPLFINPDNSWSRTFSLEKGTKVRYIFTLGSWKTECGKDGGQKPDVDSLLVEEDITVTKAYPEWKTPSTDAFVDIMMVYIGLLFTGFLMIAYGQFMLSWESNHFDLLLVRGINFYNYFRAKYILLILSGLIFYLLTIPLVYFGKTVLLINSALTLYNIGINALLMLFICTFTRKRMDLNASILSTQGKGGIQYSMILPTIILPVIIFLVVRLFFDLDMGIMVLSVLGILALLSHKPALQLIQRQFSAQRYKISAGFHQL